MNDPALLPRKTQAQVDTDYPSWYRINAVAYALEYYIAGRFAAWNRLPSVAPALLQYAVELLIKAGLSKGDTADQIRRYWRRDIYGHDLGKLWEALKKRRPGVDLSEFNETIVELHRFEDLRFPDDLIEHGALISLGAVEAQKIMHSGSSAIPLQFCSTLPPIDRLISFLFDFSDVDWETVKHRYGEEAMKWLERENRWAPRSAAAKS